MLVFLEVIGFSGGQKNLEALAGKVGISDIFDIGQVQEKDVSMFGSSNSNNQTENTNQSESQPIAISNISSFPKDVSRSKPKIQAEAAYVYDLDSGRVLFSQNPEKIRPIASVTKIMTAIVILENKDLDEVVTVTPAASWVTGSKMYLYPYEKIKAKDLVYGMLIKSANDAAKALEAHYGKEDLVALMNEEGEWLGLSDTKFTEASGLDQEDTSSAKDLSIISGYALRNKIFRNIIRKKKYTVYSFDGKIQHLLTTTNRLLKNYPDIYGLKTGFTDEAGYCLVSLAEQDGHQIVAIVLGSPTDDGRFNESRRLLDWAFSAYQW